MTVVSYVKAALSDFGQSAPLQQMALCTVVSLLLAAAFVNAQTARTAHRRASSIIIGGEHNSILIGQRDYDVLFREQGRFAEVFLSIGEREEVHIWSGESILTNIMRI